MTLCLANNECYNVTKTSEVKYILFRCLTIVGTAGLNSMLEVMKSKTSKRKLTVVLGNSRFKPLL